MTHRHAAWLVAAALVAGCNAPPSSSSTQSTTSPPAASTPASQPATGPVAPPTTEPEMIASAMSAAPDAISREATIVAMNDKMEMRTLRPGTNGWTCMPDGPSPGVDPMCLDKNGAAWAMAWLHHQPPPADKMGIGYMLMGGSDASNADPFATAPHQKESWVETGPHLMVLGMNDRFAGYPTTATNPKAPYVMFPNTPYAHLMMPVH